MGTIYAQSTLGIVFIAAYWAVFVASQLPSKKGFVLMAVSIFLVAGFIYYLTTRLSGSRVYQLLTTMFDEGVMGIEDDASVEVRYNSLWRAITGAFENYLIPLGFRGRVGSAYGGFLCETGIVAIPFLFTLSYIISMSFKSQPIRIIYFIVFTVLMFNNTQLGNPLLLIVVAANAFLGQQEYETQINQNRWRELVLFISG